MKPVFLAGENAAPLATVQDGDVVMSKSRNNNYEKCPVNFEERHEWLENIELNLKIV